MPVWLQIVVACAALLNFAIGATYFFDKYFRSRRATDRDARVEKIGELAWTQKERIDLEHRLSKIEGDVAMLTELQELRQKVMANILHSPHRPELDRLLEKIDRGQPLTPFEMTLAKDFLWQIIIAKDEEGVSTGEKATAGDIYAGLCIEERRREARA